MAESTVQVKLFENFDKRTNSTKRPNLDNYYWSGTCSFFDNTSITAPILKLIPETIPPEHKTYYIYESTNYCYIDNFDRYYWIVDWQRNEGLWIATLTEDTLASWRGTILNSTQYVKRATQAYDFSLPDNFYPYTLKGLQTIETEGSLDSDSVYEWKSPANRTEDELCLYVNAYFMGYITKQQYAANNGEGGTKDQNEKDILNNEFSNITVVSKNTFKKLVRYMQSMDNQHTMLDSYIKRIFYLPVKPNQIKDSYKGTIINGALYYGDWTKASKAKFNIDNRGEPSYNDTTWQMFPTANIDARPDPLDSGTIPTIPFVPLRESSIATCKWTIENPLWSLDRPYQKAKNYTKMFIKFLPFGTIEIDPDFFAEDGNRYIHIECDIDLNCGDANLYIIRNDRNARILISSSSVAIEKQYSATWNNSSELSRNKTNGLVSLALTAAGIGASIYTGGASAIAAAETAPAVAEATESIAGAVINQLPAMAKATHTTLSTFKPEQSGVGISGMPGSMLIDEAPSLIIQRYDINQTDVGRFGWLVMKPYQLSTLLDGYCSCINAKLPQLNGMLLSEINQIESALNSGVYLE